MIFLSNTTDSLEQVEVGADVRSHLFEDLEEDTVYRYTRLSTKHWVTILSSRCIYNVGRCCLYQVQVPVYPYMHNEDIHVDLM